MIVRRPISSQWSLVLGLFSLASALALYAYMSYSQHLTNPGDTTIPSFLQMFEGVKRSLKLDRSEERWLVVDSLATLTRLFAGLGISVVLSVLTGILMASFGFIEALFKPLLTIAAKVVPTAALAVFFVLVGTDLEMYVTMIVFGVTPQLTLSIFLAAKAVPKEMIDKALTLGASPMEVVWGVIFPSVLPQIMDGVRLAIGPALVYLIAAEMLVGDAGYGYRIRLLQKRLDMDLVYPYLAFLAGFGFLMDFGLQQLRNLICPWYAGSRR